MACKLCAFLACVSVAALASAGEAFKCTAADGAVSFQDKPCKPGARAERFVLPDAADAPLPTAEPTRTDETQAPTDAPSVATRAAAPEFIICTRDDGTRYRNDSGQVAVRLVPVEIARPTPRSIGAPASHARIGGGSAYTPVTDECHRAAAAEACAFLREQLEDTEDEIRHTFRDGAAQKAAADLRDQLRGC